IEELDPMKIPPVYSSNKLDESKKILLKMNFPFTDTEVHKAVIVPEIYPSGRELVAHITKEVRKRARIACDFNVLYPIIERYILENCFKTKIADIEDGKLRRNLSDISVQEAIIDTLAKELGRISVETRKATTRITTKNLSDFPDFPWRRKHVRCKKTVFNFVAVYNNYEEEFAKFLDRCSDISRFAALANLFSVDYLSSRGAIRLYFPDFVAVQTGNGKEVHWIIETRGREYEDADQKDKAIKTWCEKISTLTGCDWKFIKIYQSEFEEFKKEYEGKTPKFSDLVTRLIS
ncbi:MAG: hypothetical protein ABIK11_05815, partial [candidate division WOR-3 bacterium]